MIVIVDYGMGNVGSIHNMLSRIGHDSVISSESKQINGASHLILPGVGAFDSGMKNLERLGLIELLAGRVHGAGVPLLGVCLGLQLLTEASEEGRLPGLGWLPGRTVRFDISESLKIPHMGWNTVNIRRPNALITDTGEEQRFYFVHSYHLSLEDERDVAATCQYGYEFPAIVERGNICGTQFHPEKSHRFGRSILESFARSSTIVREDR
jgi:imidazole glycerol-phosphate synthase subunit HisH